MSKVTEVVEVTTAAVHPQNVDTAAAVDEFKRVCTERGLTVEGTPEAVMTSFVVGQRARFSVTAECKPSGKPPKVEDAKV